MTEQLPRCEYLVLSRGQWDGSFSRDDIQKAITQFYAWYDGLVKEGKIKPGHRLTHEGKTIGRQNKVLDGPFGETKEVIGGYWTILANSFDEAVRIAQGIPTLKYGLFVEIRPIDPQRATPENSRP
jgi:hypothetical protein